ncbi:hypothetical protein [Streptomyces sp. NPDC047024]|uniref:hypothetical protein n=1 Tax=Streptomyces sp. NPDC047024 TaxID=3155476 RepID=UPI003411590F
MRGGEGARARGCRTTGPGSGTGGGCPLVRARAPGEAGRAGSARATPLGEHEVAIFEAVEADELEPAG